jgi:sugar/nucleoside kinase (ribokinase family)
VRTKSRSIIDIAVCGNPTLDELSEEGKALISPGGTALFASCAAQYLGARVRIVGNIGEDYPSSILKWLKHRGLNTSALSKTRSPSTRFRIGYSHESRRLWLLDQGHPVAPTWIGGKVDGLHVGPVFNEVSDPLARTLRKRCGLMSLDVQELVRRVNRFGEVQVSRRNIDRVLRLCDMVKASITEAKILTSSRSHRGILDSILARGPKFVVITLGGKGSLLGIGSSRKFFIPAYPEKRIEDPTGAGDVYAGAWLCSYLWTKDPVWAAAVGSAFGSLASQRTGLSKFGISRRELFRRTSWVYNHVRLL